MPITESQKRATYNYKKRNYSLYQVTMPKELKTEIDLHTKETKESINGFIIRSIKNQLSSDKQTGKTEKTDVLTSE